MYLFSYIRYHKIIIMKKLIIFSAFVIFFASCKKDMASDNLNQTDLTMKKYASIADRALLAKSKEESSSGKRPDIVTEKSKKLKSFGSGTISYTPNGCGAETLQFNSDGTGNSTTLGFFTQKTTFCIGANNEVIGFIDGVATTGNGDQVFYRFIDTGTDPATEYVYQDYIFTGGTGKYEGATGNMTLLYHVNTPSHYSYTGTGTITY